MKINRSDGSILFKRGTVLPMQNREAFLASDLGSGATVRLVNREWWHVSISPEPGIAGTLIFKGDRLDCACILLDIPSDKTSAWTMELELQRKALHDRWLRDELGDPPYKYTWGAVASEFDAKGVVSEIIVAYDR